MGADDGAARRYVAIVNVPGYLSMDDDPPTFDTARAAWAYLADERQREEDSAPDWPAGDVGEYTTCVTYLRHAASDLVFGDAHEDFPLGADGTGVIYGDTPGYDGEHDLGLAYGVSIADDDA